MYPSRNSTFFQCTTCLKGGPNGANKGLDQNLFFNFPSDQIAYAAGILLSFGAYDRVTQYGYDVGSFSSREYSSENHALHFINELGAMRYDRFGENWYRTPVVAEDELHAAHLTARLPILAIVGAERQLPRVPRNPGASEQPYIVTSLEVKWGRGMGVLGAILAGQLVAVGVVYAYSRKVWIRDHDSFLSIASVLSTAIEEGKGKSSDTGRELATKIGGVASGIRYGTSRGKSPQRDKVKLEIWKDVGFFFPKREENYF